jgi:hypothetical protein
LITALRKRTLQGALYKRSASIEALLAELAALPRAELVDRCATSNRSDPAYVPGECLMYFVRACRADNSDQQFERFYKLLAARVLGALPNPETVIGEIVQVSQTKSRIREAAFGRFVELLAEDRQAYSEKLDYFEVRFDGAVANLRRDAQSSAWRDENRTTTIETDPETNEPSKEVEKAVGSFNPFETPENEGHDYRLRLDAAIDALPREQIRTIEMLRHGVPIDSKDPYAVTIAKALGKSEKMVRIYKERAFATLRASLLKGSDK